MRMSRPSCCVHRHGQELEEALSTALAQVDKRVWVGIRLRPHDRHDGRLEQTSQHPFGVLKREEGKRHGKRNR